MSFDSYTEAGAADGPGADTAAAAERFKRVAGPAYRPEAQAGEPRRFDRLPLTKLVGYLIDRHHVYARRQVAGIGALLAELSAGGESVRPELARVRRLFRALRQELLCHMEREEVSVFPHVIRAETAEGRDEEPWAAGSDPFLASVRMLMHEHDELCAMLDEIRAATDDYTPPRDACESHATLYKALRDLELDLLQHIHLEDNVLFPRALGSAGRGRG